MDSPSFSLSDAMSGGMKGMAKQFDVLQKQNAETEKAEKANTDTFLAGATADEAERKGVIEKAKEPGGGLTPPTPKPLPQATQTSPLQQWGSAAMWIAALGGLLTRRPAINSLNAATAVLNAYKQHDKEATESAFNTWKVENDNAIQMFKFANDSMRAQLEAIGESEKERFQNYQVVAKSLGDEQAAKMGTFDEAFKFMAERDRHADAMQRASIEIEKNLPVMRATNEVANNYYKLQALKQSGKGTPEQIAAGTKDLTESAEELKRVKGTVGGGSFRSLPAMVANKYAQEHPDATAEDMENFAMGYGEKTKAARDFGTGKQGDIVRSLNVSVAHLETLRELGKVLDNGDVTQINAAKQRFAEEFGVPAPTNFDAAKSIVADEVAKGVIGGQSAQSDRETLAASLRRAGGPKVIDGAIGTFQKLLGGQLGGLRQQYQRTTGQDNFDEAFLSPATRKALEGGSGGNSAPKKGDVVKGYRFKGGDPADPHNWEKT